MSNLDYVEH
jgi:ATP-binding cassette, subfamily G (WHITE), eye pigment precursor transporter